MLDNVFFTVVLPVSASSTRNECNVLINSTRVRGVRGGTFNPSPIFVSLITAAIAGKSISSSSFSFVNCCDDNNSSLANCFKVNNECYLVHHPIADRIDGMR